MQNNYNDLLAKTAAKPSGSRTVTLTISPLPNGKIWTLNIGSKKDRCVSEGTMALECMKKDPYLGYVFDAFLVAMIATPTPLSSGQHSYLIGCNVSLSANCAPLVPGDYPSEYVGTDGISIAGLTTKGRTDDSPHHAIFTVYGVDE